jgi:hypothetical protein
VYSTVTTFQHITNLIITIVTKDTIHGPFCNSGYRFYVSRGGAHNPKYKDAMQVHCTFRYEHNNILNHKYVVIHTKIVIFLLKCKKQAPGTIHYDYYYCWYMLCNTNRKKKKQVLEHGADVSISNLNYGFNFWFSFFH